MGYNAGMDKMHGSLLAAVAAAGSTGLFGPGVAAFLSRPAALDFMEEFLQESGAPLGDAIPALLCAIRYLDLRGNHDSGLPTVLEAPPGAVNLDLYLVRHHAELYHLCRSRLVQTNLPERALPVMEILAARFPSQNLAVIEAGSSFGLIGRALCSPDLVRRKWAMLFEPGQQEPRAMPLVSVYRGIDRSPPEADWALACVPFPSVRQRTAWFIEEVPAGPGCTVSRGSALDLPEHPAVRELVPRFDRRHPEALVPVVLTSFLLSRLNAAKRQALTRLCRQFASAHGGAWLNLDFEEGPDAAAKAALPRCLASLDGEPRLVLDSEYCRSWKTL
jgi:hypothetical protein